MVEGGASVISAFLASNLVDLVIITIAPVLVGDGIGLLREGVRPYLLPSRAAADARSTADRTAGVGACRHEDVWEGRGGGV